MGISEEVQKMLSLVGIGDFGYRLVDTDTLRVIIMSAGELKASIHAGNKIDNIGLNNRNGLCGTNGSLNRYKDGVRSNSLVVLYKTVNRYDTLFYVANSMGKVVKMHEDALIRDGRRYTIANGAICKCGTGNNERVYVKSIKGSFKEKVEKSYERLELEDYMELYKGYSKIQNGCKGTNAVGTVINCVNTARFVFERRISEPDFDNFMINYKIVQSMFTRFGDYTCERVFANYIIEKDGNKIRARFGLLAGYLVTFYRLQTEMFIPAFDKNIIQRFDRSKVKNLSIHDIRKLFIYNRDEPADRDSVGASVQICKGFNKKEVKHFDEELSMNGIAEIRMHDDFTFNLGEVPKVRLRYNLSIKSRDIRMLRAIIMG